MLSRAQGVGCRTRACVNSDPDYRCGGSEGHNGSQAAGKHPCEVTCAKGEKYKDVTGLGLRLAADARSLRTATADSSVQLSRSTNTSTALPREGGASLGAGSVHTEEHV